VIPGSAGSVSATHPLPLPGVQTHLEIVERLAAVLAAGAGKRLLRGVAVADMVSQGGGRGAGHVAAGAAVVIYVAPHVVPQQTLQGVPLAAVGAGEAGLVLLPTVQFLALTVVEELDLQ
jgi:hypothetical protein